MHVHVHVGLRSALSVLAQVVFGAIPTRRWRIVGLSSSAFGLRLRSCFQICAGLHCFRLWSAHRVFRRRVRRSNWAMFLFALARECARVRHFVRSFVFGGIHAFVGFVVCGFGVARMHVCRLWATVRYIRCCLAHALRRIALAAGMRAVPPFSVVMDLRLSLALLYAAVCCIHTFACGIRATFVLKASG